MGRAIFDAQSFFKGISEIEATFSGKIKKFKGQKLQQSRPESYRRRFFGRIFQ
jgi:hypothetical protein